jgi:DNA-binding transcriptional ArsR family regulator
MPAAAAAAAALLRAMANPQRLLVLCHLAEGELSVGALQARMELSQSALSQHLAKLRQGELVSTRRDAQTVYYALPNGPVQAVMATLHDVYCGAGPKRA